jgi:hypothetical protein
MNVMTQPRTRYRPRSKGESMSPISRITATLVAGAAFASGAIEPQATYPQTGAPHHRTHNTARSMPGRRHLLHAIAAALTPLWEFRDDRCARFTAYNDAGYQRFWSERAQRG